MQLNLKRMNDQELLQSLDEVVRTERRITRSVIEHIAEVDRRRLYLESHASLFEFLTLEHEYSNHSAQRRIDAARLLNEIPEISEKLDSGALSVTQISKVQQAFRQASKLGNRVPLQEKREILEKVAQLRVQRKSSQAKNQHLTNQDQNIKDRPIESTTELFLAQTLDLPVEYHSKEKTNSDDAVTLTLTISKEEMFALKKAQELLSHAVPSMKWQDLFVYMAKKVIQSKSPAQPAAKSTNQSSADKSSINSQKSSAKALTPTEAPNKQKTTLVLARKSIPLSLRKWKMAQSLGCERRLQNGELCGSHHFLQIDHIRPVWAGGTNDVQNLRVLCGAHNRECYRKQAGLRSA
jgi:hypothetical protein